MIDRIDRLPDGRHEVIDYKTHFDVQTEGQLADDLQMRFYALGARESLAIAPDVLTLDYVAAGKKVSVPYAASGEEALKKLITEAADRIEEGDFSPRTEYCPRCEFRKACPHSAARD